MTTETKPSTKINGIDVSSLFDAIHAIEKDPAQARMRFSVTSRWTGQTRTETKTRPIVMGGETIPRDFTVRTDEPLQLCGSNTQANPQEVLFAALNACMMVGYAVGAAAKGITLEKLELDTDGELDLRGFLGLDPDIPPGYESIRYTVRIKGNGTPAQFQEIHDTVMKTSPNRFNLAQPIRLDADLVVE